MMRFLSRSVTCIAPLAMKLAMTLVTVLAVTLVVAPKGHADDQVDLSARQASVAQRYQVLEELLLRLADVENAENPERSALLRRAARQSRDKFVLEKLKTASESLRTQQFQQAVDNQEQAGQELAALLKLLLSEDRSKRIRDEKQRLAKLIKDLKRNLNNQRSTRARTENGADLDDVQGEQRDVTNRSQELKQRLADENESNESLEGESGDEQPPSEEQPDGEEKDSSRADDEKEAADGDPGQNNAGGKDQKSDPSDGADPQDGKPKDTQQDDGKQDDGKQEDSQQDSQQGDPSSKDQENKSDGSPQPSQPSDSKPSESKPGQSQPNDSSQSQPPSQQSESGSPPPPPATAEEEVEQRLQQAIEKMQQAEKALEQAKRESATDKQRQAEEDLRAAIDRLERILRQLREEEMQRELARLESRLRKMAAMQTRVLEDTIALSEIPKTQRNRQTDLKAGDLAFEEKKITLEADRAMLLLREEGSSVAFPEVVSQIRSDTMRVADLLGQTKIDAISQGIQQDILAALEEMIAALQKAQRDLEKQRQQQQQGGQQQQGQGEQPLVESLAELKLIRTMETRIKSTTDRYAELLELEETAPDDVLPLLRDLSERQNRLYRITRDLVLKRNQ